ncbi:shikimate kinase [Bacillus andreraoultii]|uniref:shikimate kinase n=1 Tax=Bacillus andreraoultii TaxID=1499685 RepID=UPI000539667A|nr:shikimate kinase [Bacillus andreraoultii]
MKNKLVIIGMPGSGKTTLGKMVAEKTGKQFIDLDDYIVEMSGKTIPQLFEQGEEYFREVETNACLEVARRGDLVIATGGGVVKKSINMEILRKDSVIVFLNRPLSFIMNDIEVGSRPLLKAGKKKLLTLYEERFELYKDYADEIVVNDGKQEAAVETIIGIMIKNSLC